MNDAGAESDERGEQDVASTGGFNLSMLLTLNTSAPMTVSAGGDSAGTEAEGGLIGGRRNAAERWFMGVRGGGGR